MSTEILRAASLPIRVLIIENHQMVSEMMARILRDEGDIEVVGAAENLFDADTLLEREAIDVVLMDYNLPDGNGISAASEIRKRYPQTKVVIITGSVGEHILKSALSAGCAGYLLKTEHAGNIPLAIRAAHAGSTAISPESLVKLVRSSSRTSGPDELSPREMEVLTLISRGQAVEQIAQELALSEHTVRNHTQSILEKLDAHSKLEAVMAAHRLGLVKLDQ